MTRGESTPPPPPPPPSPPKFADSCRVWPPPPPPKGLIYQAKRHRTHPNTYFALKQRKLQLEKSSFRDFALKQRKLQLKKSSFREQTKICSMMRQNAHDTTGPTPWTKSRMTLACTSRLLHTRQLSSRSLQSVPAPLLASHLATSACYALITFHPPIRLSTIPICLIHQVDWPPSIFSRPGVGNLDQTFTIVAKLLVHLYV